METEALTSNHYALLVENIDATVGHLTSKLSCRFRSPARIPFEVSGHGERYRQDVRACYDVDGVVELVEAHDHGPFARSVDYGLHHFGGVVGDLENAVGQQRDAGNEVEWELSYRGQLIAVFFRGGKTLPGRLELVTAQRPPLLDLFAESSSWSANA